MRRPVGPLCMQKLIARAFLLACMVNNMDLVHVMIEHDNADVSQAITGSTKFNQGALFKKGTLVKQCYIV